MLRLEDKGGRPDRNEPDLQVRPGITCLLYGFTQPMLANLNGSCVFVISQADTPTKIANNLPLEDDWFYCKEKATGMITYISRSRLMCLDIADGITIVKLRNS